MQEQIQPVTDQRVHDQALAWEMAYVEKPYRELEQHAQELKLGGVAVSMAEQANAASAEALIHFDQSKTEEPKPGAERISNPYERLTDEQLEAVKTNITDSITKGIKSYDRQEVARAGANLFAVQRESERRFPGTHPAPKRGKVSEGYYQTTTPETSTVEGIVESLKNTESASDIAFGLRNTVEDEFRQDGKFPSEEAIMEASEVQLLLSEVAKGLQALDAGNPPKNQYSGRSNEEVQRVAERFDENISSLEAAGKVAEANKAKALRTQVQEVIDRRYAVKHEDARELPSSELATDLKIKYETFREAQKAKKQLSDSFIDGAISDELKVGEEKVGIKGFLDKVEATSKDSEVIDDPERIAGLFLRTTEMLTRNLKVAIARGSNPEQAQARREQVKQAKEGFLAQIGEEAPQAADAIVDWCKGAIRRFPVSSIEYHGFNVDGTDVLDAAGKGSPDVRPNFKIQRQIGGVFVMAYTDTRVREKMAGQDEVLDKRIYLNPDMEATPELFEQLLRVANENGISMQLKMFQRAPEAATNHKDKAMGRETGGLRGDGIVIYADGDQADEVLGMVLALAKDNPDAFRGRKTSRITQNVAEGIAVGDEPVQLPGTSLTSHREQIFSYAAEKTRASGKQGEEARILFRSLVRRTAIANGVSADNIAFNKAA